MHDLVSMSELALQMISVSIEIVQIMFVVTELLLWAGLARSTALVPVRVTR